MNPEKKQEFKDFHFHFEQLYRSKINELMDASADKIKDELGDTSLMSSEQRFQALKVNVEESIKKLNKELERVDEAIDTFERNKTRFLSNEELDKLNNDLHEYANNIKNLQPLKFSDVKEKSIKDILGISDHILYCYYKVAFHLFDEKIYQEASNIFFYLSLLNPLVKDYWLALGVCEKEKKNYNGSLIAFAIASLMDEKDPVPYLNSASCYILIKDADNAQIELENAKTIASNSTNSELWEPFINKLQEEINNIKTT